VKGQELERTFAAEQPPALIAEDHRRVNRVRALEEGNRMPERPARAYGIHQDRADFMGLGNEIDALPMMQDEGIGEMVFGVQEWRDRQFPVRIEFAADDGPLGGAIVLEVLREKAAARARIQNDGSAR
jgi:hypothetical protein